uniref:RRM domain-containing protein n=1 Tax=Alexandrium monilatum TaxID=311494 RepID=A0A7S4VUT1_9DINO|mmetsp:Transcript_36002/g.107562  ORF Transcript_36002/g.107562 Transcript_36002/m.107562 type:complete len:756 (-) Transcript_36002:131-2398(-)
MDGEAAPTRAEGSVTDAVEEFIAVNQVDGSAADALRDCPRGVQQAVLDRGGLSGARNPSSVLLARIRDASTPMFHDDGSNPDGVGYVRLRGIPFSATPEDILRFFEGLGALSEGVVIGTTREGRLSGEAFVQFPNTNIAREAIEKRNRASMGDRYIELFPSTPGEAQRASQGEPRHGDRGDNRGWGDDRSGHGNWDGPGRSISEDEVEEFLRSNDIDDHAAGALRELPPKMQAAVIDRGGLGNARNPSSVLLSRIRDAQNPPPLPPPPPSAVHPRGKLSDRVEKFLEESLVDESAAEAFRNCHPDVQEEIMKRGVATARNPSSALVGRIRDVENAFLGGGGQAAPAPRGGGGGGLASVVEDFIRTNGIDDRAADTLRNCHPRVQEAVLDRGDLSGTRNPSSALLSRIRDAQAGPPSGNGYPEREYGDYRGYQDGGAGRGGGSGRYSLEGAVEDFIRANYVDERASEALRSATPDVQEAVLSRGDLQGTRNPSSALLARLKDIQGPGMPPSRAAPSGTQPSMGPCTLPGALVDDLEFLLRIYSERDERAADALGRLQHVKYAMMSYPYGGPNDYYDQSYSQRPSRQYNERDRLEDQIAAFCKTNGIDSRAEDTMRRADPRVALMVMEKGVSGARNPSSALLARLREAESYVGAEPARARERGHESESYRKRSRMQDDVEAFIRSNGVDEMAAEALRRCGPEMQEVVMEKGVSGARNPSSALLARIRDLDGRAGSGGDRRGYGSAPSRRGGDRYAPY